MDDFEDEYIYEDIDDLDWSKLLLSLRSIVFFDDTFLSMQAANVAVVDQMVTKMEYGLLAEYAASGRTPMETAVLVSALSQMWTFSLYEVLRTWRGRIRDFRKQKDNGMLPALVERLEAVAEAEANTAALIRGAQARQVLECPEVLEKAEGQWEALKPTFVLVELLRMNLAKHGAPGSGNIIPSLPGYGRINSQCGALDFAVVDADRSERVLNRRDLADAVRRLSIPQ